VKKDGLKEGVYRILQGRGKNNPISSKAIAIKLGVEDSEANPVMRRKIRSCIEEEGWPVGATSQGYFWIETEDELEEYIEDLNRRAAQIRDRGEILRRAFYASEGV